MKSTKAQLKSRGYIEDQALDAYRSFSKEALLQLLNSKEATDRTIGAKLLEQFVDKSVLDAMLSTLLTEKKLYTKIALSESIASQGVIACEALIKHLGQIGQNQYHTLPDVPFKKKRYPLPRDIISRTLCKIGVPAYQSTSFEACALYRTY
ncbi:hypothetical protein [Fusibacter sp. 3D3]|uniref:hypothetical protein n=1 Tax=Fusibacter sp. 3D3 TaxID=1048380 RepID=UPI0008533445|nr:hypothetical protein [Fusibacter sp. 3D3]